MAKRKFTSEFKAKVALEAIKGDLLPVNWTSGILSFLAEFHLQEGRFCHAEEAVHRGTDCLCLEAG